MRRRGRLIACMALTLLLTACRLGGYAPLSLALTALAGPGLPGLAGLAGAGLGALVFLDFQSGLRHTAAAILIFAASSAFFDTKLYRRPGFRPAVSAGMFLLVQSVYLLHRLARGGHGLLRRGGAAGRVRVVRPAGDGGGKNAARRRFCCWRR